MEADVWGWESGIKVDRRELDTDVDMFVPLVAKVCSSWREIIQIWRFKAHFTSRKTNLQD